MKLAHLLLAIALLGLLGCASGPSLEAYLAADPDRLRVGDPKFSSCADCPVVRYRLPAGVYKSLTISREPVYALDSDDITDLKIYERRSAWILGARSFVVVAEPSQRWLSETEAVRESYPYDSIAWFEGDHLRIVTFNVNSLTQGAFWVGLFPCENDALAFAERMQSPTSTTPQSDDDYEAEVEELNARNAETLAWLESHPEGVRESPDLSAADIERLLSEGLPQFPVSPEAYYGPGHELPQCE